MATGVAIRKIYKKLLHCQGSIPPPDLSIPHCFFDFVHKNSKFLSKNLSEAGKNYLKRKRFFLSKSIKKRKIADKKKSFVLGKFLQNISYNIITRKNIRHTASKAITYWEISASNTDSVHEPKHCSLTNTSNLVRSQNKDWQK